MADIQNGAPLPTTAQTHDEIALGRMIGGREEYHVLRRKAGGEKTCGQCFGRLGRAVRVRAVDLYQLPEQFLSRRCRLAAGRCRLGRNQIEQSYQQRGAASSHGPIPRVVSVVGENSKISSATNSREVAA